LQVVGSPPENHALRDHERRFVGMIRLTEWCERNGISYTTAWRLRRDGKFPHPTRKVGRVVFVIEDEEFHGDDKVANCPRCGEKIEVEVFLR
jgi:predicted DNA-binding transcriptional regulator AlpA